MLSRNDLQQLASYHGPDVVSLYINVDPTQHSPTEYKLVLRHLIALARPQADVADLLRIERYFDLEYDWSGRGVALFSAQANDLWQNYTLPLPVANRVHVGPKPYIAPLMALWDTYGSYGVALVDKLGVRYLHYQFGELSDSEGLIGEDVRNVKSGRGSSMVGRRGGNAGHAARREAEVVRRNLKESAAAAATFFTAKACKHILVGGTEDVISEFVAALPVPWPTRVAATFPAEIDIAEGALRELALQHLTQAVQQREYDMVESVITAAAKGSNGVVRLDETLSAAHDGRIQMLLVAAGYDAEGYRCGTCGFLTTQALTQCPFCGGSFTHIPHAVEAAIEQVVAQGGDVKTIDHHAQLDEAGVAALLRY